MPHASPRSHSGLAIGLEEKAAFYPGETIIGTVTRWAKIVDSEAVLTLEFRGSAKVKITRGSGNNRHSYSQRINFWRRPIVQELYRGPIHIPERTAEPLKWPFAVQIPAQADEGMFDKIDRDAYFLKKDDPESYELPATFASGLGESDEFYIEYVLVARLRDSKRDETEAILPVTIRRSATPTPISDFGLKDYRGLVRAVSTFRLDPEYETAELSFKQKAKELFGSRKVPTLTFRLSVQHPTVLQIGHPEPAPFHVRAVLMRDKTSEVVQDPAIVVTKFKIKLDELTIGTAPSFWHTSEDSNRQKWILLEWTRKTPKPGTAPRTPSRQPSPAPGSRRGSTSINVEDEEQAGPSTRVPGVENRDSKGTTTKESSGEGAVSRGKDSLAPPEYQEQDSEAPPPDAETLIVPWETAMLPLDLGRALDFRVPLKPKYHRQDIQPSFKAISIKTQHQMMWKMELEVAGEELEFAGTQNVEVLGPSDDDPSATALPPPPTRGPWVA
jgi:hypothetical protein